MSDTNACGRTIAILTVLAALGCSVAPVRADAPQPSRWTGFYLGLNAGGAWVEADPRTNVSCGATPVPLIPVGYLCDTQIGGQAANVNAVAASGTGSISASGFTGGGQAGYSFARNGWVWGGEMDFGAFAVDGSRTGSGVLPVATGSIAPATSYTVRSSVAGEWLMTARGRFGWGSDNFLAYVTGGLAMASVELTHSYSDTNATAAGAGSFSSSTVRSGWTLGGGGEWALNNHWSIKSEYLFVDLGAAKSAWLISAPAAGAVSVSNGLTTETDLTAHIVRAGLNYRF